jgi:hypothetical protein
MDNELDKSSIEFWKKITSRNCSICGGSGVTSKDDDRSALIICKCSRLARQMAKMNDPLYGLHPSYHGIDLDDLTALTNDCASRIKMLLDGFKKSKNPYKNILIEGGEGGGKSAVAALFYKIFMLREYEVSVIKFSELAALSRMMMTNSSAFNDRSEFYHFLKEEEFLIIEDVDDRGEASSRYAEKLGYTLLDDLFSYRSKHPKKATIITSKIPGMAFTPSVLGGSYFYSILNNSIKSDRLRYLSLEIKPEMKKALMQEKKKRFNQKK